MRSQFYFVQVINFKSRKGYITTVQFQRESESSPLLCT
jgi:hypothetical protein